MDSQSVDFGHTWMSVVVQKVELHVAIRRRVNRQLEDFDGSLVGIEHEFPKGKRRIVLTVQAL